MLSTSSLAPAFSSADSATKSWTMGYANMCPTTCTTPRHHHNYITITSLIKADNANIKRLQAKATQNNLTRQLFFQGNQTLSIQLHHHYTIDCSGQTSSDEVSPFHFQPGSEVELCHSPPSTDTFSDTTDLAISPLTPVTCTTHISHSHTAHTYHTYIVTHYTQLTHITHI